VASDSHVAPGTSGISPSRQDGHLDVDNISDCGTIEGRWG
jgi:hypothetical protein